MSHRARAVRLKSIVEILPDGTRRRHSFIEARGGDIRSKGRLVGIVLGSDGQPEAAPPLEPSSAQRWLSIAAEDDLLADALTYFARGDNWFDIFKALECLF